MDMMLKPSYNLEECGGGKILALFWVKNNVNQGAYIDHLSSSYISWGDRLSREASQGMSSLKNMGLVFILAHIQPIRKNIGS